MNGKNVISISFYNPGEFDLLGVFVTKPGELYTQTDGRNECLGHGDKMDQPIPKPVDDLSSVV